MPEWREIRRELAAMWFYSKGVACEKAVASADALLAELDRTAKPDPKYGPNIDRVAEQLVAWLNALTGADYRPVVPYQTRCVENPAPPT